MIGTPQELRALTQELTASVWTLAVIGSLFESGLAAHLREAHTAEELASRATGMSKTRIERCLAVAVAAGVLVAEGETFRCADGVLPFLQQPMTAAIQGDLRTHLLQAVAFLNAASGKTPQTGWDHTDPALLQSQGDASSAAVPLLKGQIVPMLGDLAARLDKPGARFLDVGVGVASLSLSMCRAWPSLHAVGIDASDVPLGLARANVARAGLEARVELRKLALEDLRDEEVFDLVWLPSVFIPAGVLSKGVERVHAALRPGGWVLLPSMPRGGDARQQAVLALVNDTWGGPLMSPPETESLLTAAGFSSARTLPGPWGFVAAQRNE